MAQLKPKRWLLWIATLAMSCSNPPGPTTISLASMKRESTIGGERFLLTATVTTPQGKAKDEVVTFSTASTGVSISPATVAADSDGKATAIAFVSYGVTAVCQSATGDGFADLTIIPVDPVEIKTSISSTTSQLGGQLLEVTATLTAGGSKASGVPLAYATNASGIAFTPAAIASDDTGTAKSTVFVPFSASSVVALVTGGGATSTLALSLTADKLKILPVTAHQRAFGGTLVTVTAQVEAVVKDDTDTLAGLPVSFASNGANIAFSPATNPTGDDGKSLSNVFIPYGAATLAIVSAAGASTVVSLVDVLPTLTFGAVQVGTAVSGTQGSATTGKIYPVTVTVTDGGKGDQLAGVPLTFLATGGATFTPGTTTTGLDGSATSSVFIPDESGSGTAQVVVTAPGATSSPTTVP